jgi:thiamine-monophosphate kinase
VAKASGVAFDLSAQLSPDELNGGEDHSLLATFAGDVPDGFRAIGTVVEGEGVLVDGRPHEVGGWDPYVGWNGETS